MGKIDDERRSPVRTWILLEKNLLSPTPKEDNKDLMVKNSW